MWTVTVAGSLFVFCTLVNTSFSMLIGSYVVPHGGITLDPSNFNTTNKTVEKEAWILHNSLKQIGIEIDSMNPDTLLLSTPHGIADKDNFIFYRNAVGGGIADTDNVKNPERFNLSVNFDCDTTEKLLKKLAEDKVNISGLSAFGPPGAENDQKFPLRWGEIIPLYYIPNLEKRKVVVLSQPSRRYDQSVNMIPELLKLGDALYHHIEASDKRVIVIISSDLAHTHSKDGPYGYSDAAEPFDQACGEWATSLDEESLLTKAAGYVQKALSCGYTGLVMLHGMLKAGQLDSWKSHVFANYHPSYYGMMSASFLKK